jgi:SLT domain-containing protein/phage-related minor tail protein
MTNRLRSISQALGQVQSSTVATNNAINQLDNAQAIPTVSVDNGASSVINTINNQLGSLHGVSATPTVSVDDQATSRVNNIAGTINAVDSMSASAQVSLDDQATAGIEDIEARLQGLKDTVLTISAGGALAGGASSVAVGSSTLEQNARGSAATGMSTGGFNEYVNEIYFTQQTGNSREEVAASMTNWGQNTDLSGNLLKSAVLTSNQMAEIYQKDVPEIDRALSGMMKNFDIDSARAGDNIAYVFKNAGDQHEDLLDVFNEYSSTFKDMQLSPEQVSNAFVAGTKGGARNFDDMADAMREFNILRNEMSEDQVGAFNTLLGKDKAAEMFKGFKDGSYSGQEAMFEMAKGLSEIENETERVTLATTLIGGKYEDLKQPILDMAGAMDQPAKAAGELNKQYDNMLQNNPMTPMASAGRELEEILNGIGVGIITTLAPSFQELNKWMASTEGKTAIKDMTTAITDFVDFFGDKLVPVVKFGIEHFELLAPVIVLGAAALTAFSIGALIVIPILKKMKGAWSFITGGRGGGTRGLDNATEGMSRMERRSRSSARSVGSLTTKLKDLFKLRMPTGGLFGGGGDRNTRSGGGSGGLLKGLGRLALPLGIGMGVYDIATSEAGQERNQAIGGAVGGLGGAAAGAAAGSLLGPLGTIAGGALGYFGGDKIGSWIGGMFGGDKKQAASGAAGATGMTAGVEKEMKALSAKGTAYGTAFATNFSKGLNGTAVSVTTWLSAKVYAPMGNAATSSNHFGYAFSYGFVQGMNTAPINVIDWLAEKVYAPMGNAAKSANHFGYAFAYGFMQGLTTSPLTMTGWVSTNVYQPLNSAAAGSRAYGSALVYNFKEGIKAIPVNMHVWLKNHVETPTRSFVPKAMDWGSGMIGYFVTGMNRQGAVVTDTARSLAKRVEEAFRSELGIHSPSRVMADLGYWSAMGVVKGFSGVDVSNMAKSKASELMAAFGSYGGGGGAGMARSAIGQALMMLGKPMSLLNPLMTIADKESSFNPNAINTWDINAQRGDPSIGLFQVIGETFARWKVPGFDDRTNPLHSALAAIRYMDGRYGGVMNHPGIKSMAGGGGYEPYAKGGIITQDHIARVGEKGKKEVIIPLEQHRNRAMGLLEYAQNALGVDPETNVSLAAETLPDEEVKVVKSAMNKGMQSAKSGIRDVIVQILGESNYHNDMDAEKVGSIAVKAVEKKLEEEYFAMGGLAVDG